MADQRSVPSSNSPGGFPGKERRSDRTLYNLNILEEEYARFRSLFGSEIPHDYADWLKRSEHVDTVSRNIGLSPRRITIRYDEFVKFAEALEIECSYALLASYATKKGHEFGRGYRPETRQ